METRLKLVFQSQKLKLASRAAIFAALLALVKISGFNVLPTFLFLAGSVFLYASPLFKTVELIKPLLVLIAVSLLSVWAIPGNLLILLAGYCALLFYLLMGVKDLVFIQRAIWYRVLNAALAYQIFLLFFYYGQSNYLLRVIPLLIAFWLLLGDFLKKKPVYWLLVLILIEIVWAISLLPFGFLSGASLALAVYFVALDLTSRSLDNSLTKKIILIYATIFVSLMLVILGLSRWTL